ncbi:MAG: type I glutamate--ammonia ligase [bacterium]
MKEFGALDDVKEFIRENRINLIDIRYADLQGKWHHITVPAQPFPCWAFSDGVAFDSSSVPGFERVERSDLIIKPDLSRWFIDPFCGSKCLCFFSHIYSSDGCYYEKDPRYVLVRALDFLRSGGIADDYCLLPELEFYIFASTFFESEPTRSGFDIVTERNGNLKLKGGYELVPPEDEDFDIRSEITEILSEIGISVKYHHHEGGQFGQNELELAFAPAFFTADSILLAKYVIRMSALRRNLVATFMPKPIYNAPGSGLHLHQYLVKDGKNIFWSSENEFNLSHVALYFMGGLLIHMPSLVAFTNPTTNSYKRLNPRFESPNKICFGVGNRTATVRIPLYDDNLETKRFEVRTPDGTINPYLVIASMLMAGLDGIEKKIDPVELGYGPINEYSEKVDELLPLPSSLDEALKELEKDNEYLRKGGVFTDNLIDTWINLKMKEVEQVRAFPHPLEFELYFNL